RDLRVAGTPTDMSDAERMLARLLPSPVDHVMLQADLTAVAPGPLENRLARQFEQLAMIESRGGATVYRFSARTVRRALDAGWDRDSIHTFLADHSRTPVPQPLTYLVDDLAGRHGHLRVRRARPGAAAGCLLHNDDPA